METLCRIRDIYRSIAEFETAFIKQHNLCLNEGMLLCTLSKTQQCSSGEIAQLIGLTTSNTSKVIKAVEKKGYIERVMGETDKRQMYFSLTKEGKKRLEAIKVEAITLPETLQKILETNNHIV